MITQTITASMTQTNLAKILTRRYDVGREIKFILYKDELLSDPIDLTDYTVVITVIKPDNNFVIENFSGDTVTITEQMEVVTGTGYYCVHVSKDNETIYTGQGEFIIDDVLISDGELESISEVNGLKFPDDFLTVEDHVAVIDDTVTSTEKTWSSSKISDEIENVSVIVSKTAEGNPIELTDAADAPLVKCVTDITGYQRGAGTPSPDNVRPIVAYTEGEIEVSGFNQWDEEWEAGTLNSQGQPQENTVDLRSKNFRIADGGTSYCYSLITTLTGMTRYVFWYDVNKNFISYYMFTAQTTTSPTNAKYFKIVAQSYLRNYTSYQNNICFNISDASKNGTYEPYKGVDHTTTYPSAIYRGSEDVVKGKVTSDRIKAVFDGSIDEDWRANSSYPTQFAVSLNAYNVKLVGSAYAEFAICNMYDKHDVSATQRENGYMTIYNGTWSGTNGIWLAVRDDRFTTLEDFKSAIATTPIEIAYELATPTTSSVTPTNLPIKSLSGYTHIESSTGNIEIEYITQDYKPLVDSIVMESERKITKLWDAGFTPAPGVWLEYDFGEDLENYDAIVILFVVSGWEGNNSDSVTVYPKIQNLNTTKYYHYIKGSDYGIQFWRVSGTTYGLGSIDGNYPPQYKAVYGIKY